MERDTISTCMQHEMPQSLLIFAVSFMPESHTHLEDFFKKFCFLTMYIYAHI